MKSRAAIIILAILLCCMVQYGCSPHPKFTGDREESSTEYDRRNVRSERGDEFKGTTTRQLLELGRIIQSYLGTPYDGNSDYEEGLDCSRFTGEVYDRYNGTELPRTAREQYSVGRKVKKNSLRYGDLVFFRTDGRKISHVGIYIGFNEFVHASYSSGVIISRIDEKYWKKRFAGARRIIP